MAIASNCPCIKLIGESRRGETIELGNHKFYDFVGGGSQLEDCVLDIRGAAFDLVEATLTNCRIKVRRQISNKRFLNTSFENCIFEGSLVGCRFGFRFGESENPNAFYRDCDFSKATLHFCDFFKGDIGSLTWPKWPNIVVLDPAMNKRDWLSIDLTEYPLPLRVAQRTIGRQPIELEITPPPPDPIDDAPRAITLNFAKYNDVEPETVWPLIQDKPYIVFNGKETKRLA